MISPSPSDDVRRVLARAYPFPSISLSYLFRSFSRVRGIDVLVPRFQLALLEGAAAAVDRHPQLAVPGRPIGRIDERHRRALVPLVGGKCEKTRSVVRRLGKDEVRRVGQVFLVVAGLGDVPVDRAAQPEVEADELTSFESQRGFLLEARFWSDLFAADLPGRRQQVITGCLSGSARARTMRIPYQPRTETAIPAHHIRRGFISLLRSR